MQEKEEEHVFGDDNYLDFGCVETEMCMDVQ
jgi:hypothetical protein